MIRETAEITIKPGADDAFTAAVAKAVPLFQGAKGCRKMALEKVIEKDNTYRLQVWWETLEDHTVGFRESTAFQDWRALITPHIDGPPSVDHSELAVHGFAT